MSLCCWHNALSFFRHTGKLKHWLVPETVSWETVNQEQALPLRCAVKVCNQNTVSSATLACAWKRATVHCSGAHKKQNKSGLREQIKPLGFYVLCCLSKESFKIIGSHVAIWTDTSGGHYDHKIKLWQIWLLFYSRVLSLLMALQALYSHSAILPKTHTGVFFLHGVF